MLRRGGHGEMIFVGLKLTLLESAAELSRTLWFGTIPHYSLALSEEWEFTAAPALQR